MHVRVGHSRVDVIQAYQKRVVNNAIGYPDPEKKTKEEPSRILVSSIRAIAFMLRI